MSIVKFPGLNLEINISDIIFSIFGIKIYTYAFCIVVGIILALVLCKFSKENFGIEFDKVLDISIIALIFGIIGARIYYVIFNIQYYMKDPVRILNLRDGGLAIYGGLFAGAVAIIKRCKSLKIESLEFFDYIIPFVAIAQGIGRWGNFFNIEAYGYETNNIFRMGILSNNGYLEVHPVFLYESIWMIITFFILRNLQKKRRFKGQILYMYLILYAGARMFLETLRTDSLMMYGIRVSQVISIIVFIYYISKVIGKTITAIHRRKV